MNMQNQDDGGGVGGFRPNAPATKRRQLVEVDALLGR